MPRFHLIEFHEQPWVPRILREGTTDYLRTATELGGHYKPVVSLLADMLRNAPDPHLLDLGSGGGGPWIQMVPALEEAVGRPVHVRLSDYQPNIPALSHTQDTVGQHLNFETRSVDARKVPADLKGIRTLFNLFHHFRPADAKAILKDANDKRQPIMIVEGLDNSWLQAIMILLLSPLFVLLLTPLIKPFRWERLLFTYLIPLIPLMVAWDGFVSVLRLYSPKAMEEMVADLDQLEWDYGKLKKGSITLLYLRGSAK